MTQKQWMQKQRNFISKLKSGGANNFFGNAVAASLREWIQRIFEQGADFKGGQIGQYRSEAYKKYRRKRGRQVQYVNLNLEGNLRRDLATSMTRVSPLKYIVGTKRSEETNKIEHLIDRYGDRVFKISDGERKTFKESVEKGINELLK